MRHHHHLYDDKHTTIHHLHDFGRGVDDNLNTPCHDDDCPHRIHDDTRQLINNVNAGPVNVDDGPGDLVDINPPS